MLMGCKGRDEESGKTSSANGPANLKQEQPARADSHAAAMPSTRRKPGLGDSGSPLTGEVSDLQGLIADLHGKITDREIIIELPADVLFDFDKAEIRPDAVPTLEKVARLIKQSGDGIVQVNGHTDAIGTDAYNKRLSEGRAASVQQWLTSSGGIEAGRLRPTGYGKSQPVAPNSNPDGSDNPEGRQKNRRVEVIIPRK
jgi:outer membrane protein OmpA-like peptidoglycan-associated protein